LIVINVLNGAFKMVKSLRACCSVFQSFD